VQPAGYGGSIQVAWRDERDEARRLELVSAFRRAAGRRATGSLRAVPLHGDGLLVLLPPPAPWEAPRRILFADEIPFTREILRFGNLSGYQQVAQATQPGGTSSAVQSCKTCGPDITDALKQAVQKIQSQFGGWSDNDKQNACISLESLEPRWGGEGFFTAFPKYAVEAGVAWNIPELMRNSVDFKGGHRGGNQWIKSYQQYGCASPDPPCGQTVQVDKECYYSGTVNYVIFGVMCRLCHDYYAGRLASSTSSADAWPNQFYEQRYTEQRMADLISQWKSDQSAGAGNASPAEQWARAGYHGWPNAATPPGDKEKDCPCKCSQKYSGPPFHVDWGSKTF
jgi:hypothetical protein